MWCGCRARWTHQSQGNTCKDFVDFVVVVDFVVDFVVVVVVWGACLDRGDREDRRRVLWTPGRHWRAWASCPDGRGPRCECPGWRHTWGWVVCRTGRRVGACRRAMARTSCWTGGSGRRARSEPLVEWREWEPRAFFLGFVRATGESTSAFMAQHGSVRKIEMFPVGWEEKEVFI